MRRVYFDVTCLMPQRLSGIGVYARELFLALEQESIEISPVIKLSRVFKTSGVANHICRTARPFFGALEAVPKNSILHGPDFKLISHSSRFKKLVTIHDLGVFHEGFNTESFRSKGQKSIRNVLYDGRPDLIVVNTKDIADEIAERFPEFKEKVLSIYPGVNHLQDESSVWPAVFNLSEEPYFLFAGHLESRKNILGILRSFELVAQQDREVKLVLVGKDGFQAELIHQHIANSPHKNRIIVKGFISTAELKALYCSAVAFLFPSFYEGFGFPALEAMSLGCPVITSNYGTMAEVVGGAARLVNPKDDQSMASAMYDLLSDNASRSQYILLGRQRAQEFTWKKCAQSFSKAYEMLD